MAVFLDNIGGYMKKRIIIGTSCVVIFLVVFIVWIAGRKVKILQDIDVRTLSKIEIYYPGDNLTVVKEEEDMQKVIALFHSLRVRKTFADNDDGFVFSIQIYDKNEERIDIITIRSERIVTNDGYYKCDRDYCDDFRKLHHTIHVQW